MLVGVQKLSAPLRVTAPSQSITQIFVKDQNCGFIAD